MTDTYNVEMALLRKLSTVPQRREKFQILYDDVQQVSSVLEGGEWIPSWDARSLNGTKKEDHETGEDAKGS
jgi:hypothetical protein